MKSPLARASSIMKERYGERSTESLKPRNTRNTRKIPEKEIWISCVSCFSWSQMPWIDQPISFIDFEGSVASGILEYGVAMVERGEIVDTRTRLCGPVGQVRPQDTAVHGLDAQSLAAQAPFADEWEFFAGLRERGP